MDTVNAAKFIMKKFQTVPVFDKDEVGELNEVFQHIEFLNSSLKEKQEIMLKSSQWKYDDELNYPFDKYFGFDLLPMLSGKSVLDLGCFSGGRSVAWFEKYKLKKISGIEVDQFYIDAAIHFAKIKSVNSDFRLGYGEAIPFEDDQFDAILTYDVFEHVQDLKKTIDECYRVLKPGGKLIAVFPGYYQPIEHHLSLVTRFPCLQYVFSGQTLVKAYSEIIEERGADADWYKRKSAVLEEWEKGNIINGTTLNKLSGIIKNQNWRMSFLSRKPIGTVGRFTKNKKWLRIMSSVITPLTYIPYIQEIFLHRISFIIEKPHM
jgi:SAM-dependent methyltransferase